ncbi:MAG: hypothetical protein ACK5KR_07060 [Breznakia sp.]
MNVEFKGTRIVEGIVEFDKENQLWRIVSDPNKIYKYEIIENVKIIEIKKNQTSGVLGGIASTMVAPAAYAQPSAVVKLQIKVKTSNQDIVFDTSTEYVRQGTLDYNKERSKADEIRKKLKIIEKRNKAKA